jgi:nucleoside-diphosphate-sugar epimerase
LVTGATGFIGRRLTRALCQLGEPVRILVRRSSNLSPLSNLPVEVVYGDLADLGAVRVAVRGVRRVFNCAGMVGDWGPWAAYQAANIMGVDNLLRAVRSEDHLERFVHVSTSDVYGYPNRRHVTEDAPFVDRRMYYNSSKIAGERLAWRAYREHGVPLVVVRPASVYGPEDPNYVGEILTLLRSGSMMFVDGGCSIAGLTYVDNVADLLLLAGERPAAVGQAFNVSDGSAVTWRDFVNRLAMIAGTAPARLSLPHDLAYVLGWSMEQVWRALRRRSRPLVTRQAVENTGTHQDFSIARAQRMLGYTPRVGFDEGMERVARWLYDRKP